MAAGTRARRASRADVVHRGAYFARPIARTSATRTRRSEARRRSVRGPSASEQPAARSLAPCFSLSLSFAVLHISTARRTMSRRTSSRPPAPLRLPPLPTPPQDALALLDADLLPASIAPPARSRTAPVLGSSARQVPAGGGESSRSSRGSVGSAARRRSGRGAGLLQDEDEEGGSGWESDDGHDKAQVGKLVILSEHPALVKVRWPIPTCVLPLALDRGECS